MKQIEDSPELEEENLLLSLKPGEFVRRGGAVFACGHSGLRGAMAYEVWQHIQQIQAQRAPE